MRIQEIITPSTNHLSFLDHMIDAVSAAGAGFHFEEGGCWGMALALYDELRPLGAEIIVGFYDGRPSHAMVRIGSRWLDHQGDAQAWSGEYEVVTPKELMMWAARAGYEAGEVLSDRADSAAIIQSAKDWSD